MTRFRQTLTGAAIATALMASFAMPSLAQTAAAPTNAASAAHSASDAKQPSHADKRAKRAEQRQQRAEKFKAELKLSPAQEAAWQQYTEAMKPAARPARGDRQAFAQLTTPERIDKMRELRTQRNAQMDRRGEASKAFYAQLSAEQQKTFDSATLRMHQRGGKGKHHAHQAHHARHQHGHHAQPAAPQAQ